MLNIYTLIMLLSSFLAAISQILLKLSAKKNHKNWIMEYINPFVISGYLLLLLTMIMNIYAYSGIDYKFGPIKADSLRMPGEIQDNPYATGHSKASTCCLAGK